MAVLEILTTSVRSSSYHSRKRWVESERGEPRRAPHLTGISAGAMVRAFDPGPAGRPLGRLEEAFVKVVLEGSWPLSVEVRTINEQATPMVRAKVVLPYRHGGSVSVMAR